MDHGATISLKPTCYDIANDFFLEKHIGPHQTPVLTNKGWLELTNDAVAKVETARANTAQDDQPKAEFMSSAKAENRKRALDKARAALSEKKADLQSKRVVKFKIA